LLAPQRGLIAIGKEQENLKPMDSTGIVLSPRHESMIEMHIPENVKLWESPGRAGGLPDCNYISGQSPDVCILPLRSLVPMVDSCRPCERAALISPTPQGRKCPGNKLQDFRKKSQEVLV